jgi:hypothetical protein
MNTAWKAANSLLQELKSYIWAASGREQLYLVENGLSGSITFLERDVIFLRRLPMRDLTRNTKLRGQHAISMIRSR